MGALFGGGGGGGSAPAPVIIQAPTPVVPVAPRGPQLAPGQTYPGGPIGPIPAPAGAGGVGGNLDDESEDMKRWRRMLGNNTILGDYGGSADGNAGNAVGGNANSGPGETGGVDGGNAADR